MEHKTVRKSVFIVYVIISLFIMLYLFGLYNSVRVEYKDKIESYRTLCTYKDEKYDDLESTINNYKDQQSTIDDLNNKLTELQNQYDTLQSERDSLQQQVNIQKYEEEQAVILAQQQQYEDDSYDTVYWSSGGECYHSTPDCVGLKRSTDISSGSIAMSDRRACKLCN